jgi:hypothetical protein
MKIAYYDSDNKLINFFEDIINPRINGNDILSDRGYIEGLKNWIIIEDSVEVPETLTAEAKKLDKKGTLPKFSKPSEQEKNRESRMQGIEMAIMSIMERIGKL